MKGRWKEISIYVYKGLDTGFQPILEEIKISCFVYEF